MTTTPCARLMRHPDARRRPSGRVSGAKAPPSRAGASADFTARAAVIHLESLIRPGDMACEHKNGPWSGVSLTSWYVERALLSAFWKVSRHTNERNKDNLQVAA